MLVIPGTLNFPKAKVRIPGTYKSTDSKPLLFAAKEQVLQAG